MFKKINNSDKIIVNADKTGNKYEISASNYQWLMHDNLTRDYKLDDGCNQSYINSDTRKHAHSLDNSRQNGVPRITKRTFPTPSNVESLTQPATTSERLARDFLTTLILHAGKPPVSTNGRAHKKSCVGSPIYMRTTLRRRKEGSYSSTFVNFTHQYQKNFWENPSHMREPIPRSKTKKWT